MLDDYFQVPKELQGKVGRDIVERLRTSAEALLDDDQKKQETGENSCTYVASAYAITMSITEGKKVELEALKERITEELNENQDALDSRVDRTYVITMAGLDRLLKQHEAELADAVQTIRSRFDDKDWLIGKGPMARAGIESMEDTSLAD